MRTAWHAVLLALLAAASTHAAPDDETAVREVFAHYKAALMAGDGNAAVTLVDAATLEYYAELRQLALSGGEEEIRARSFIERLLIVSIRHQLPPEQVATLDLAELIRIAVAENWISPQSIAQLDMAAVTVDGDEASGEAVTAAASEASGGNALDSLHYRFVREEGRWRFRFSSLVQSLDRIIADLAKQLGVEEDDLIFTLVEAFSGRQVLPDVWERPQ